MKRICILLLLILLLVGCTANEEPLLIPPATEPPASTEAPLQTEAPTEPPDAGIASVQIVAPEALTVTAEDPSARFSVQFTQVDLTGALERGRLCTLRLSQDGKVLAEDLFLLNEGASADFCVDYAFERYMEQTSSLLTVSLLYQEEQLDAEIPVTLENRPDEYYAAESGDPLPYSIDVVRNQNVVLIYGKGEDGAYTKLVHAFLCSTGWTTPSGRYTLGSRSEWWALFRGVFGQYAIGIYGDYLFHSVPYRSMRKDTLESEEFNKLGTQASMGCVRLAVADVKWIFDNCPYGTPVHLYDADELPVERPEQVLIDLDDPRAGWDPTDPDENNPWHTEDAQGLNEREG